MEQMTLALKRGAMPNVPTFSDIRETLKTRGRQNDNTMALLVFDWPVVQSIAEGLASHVTDALHDKRGPVLFSIIEGALVDYQRFSQEVRRRGQPDAARLAAFASALIHNTANHLSYEFKAGAGSSWRVDGKVTFSAWHQNSSLTKNTKGWKAVSLSDSDTDEAISLISVYQTLINPKTQVIFKELGYEKAVVSGRASAGAAAGRSPDSSAG